MAAGLVPGSTLLSAPQAGRPLDIAIGYLGANAGLFGISGDDLSRAVVTSQYTDADIGTTHIYLRQGYNGVGVYGKDLNISIAADGSVITAGGRFEPTLGTAPSQAAPPAPALTSIQAFAAAANLLNQPGDRAAVVKSGPFDTEQRTLLSMPGVTNIDSLARLQYVYTTNGARLAWEVPLASRITTDYFDAYIDATSGALLHLDNWAADYSSSYNVLSVDEASRSPDDGNFVLVSNPDDPLASPYGWHNTGTGSNPTSTLTVGNNVNAYDDSGNQNAPGFQPDGGAALRFDFPVDLASAPSLYKAAAVTNLFYVTNRIHDIWYRYGFTEAAGNFQTNNYGKGGLGNDAVQAEAQDGGGVDNANFATPPDGTPGRMQMYIWDLTSPNRDGDLQNEIIAHEYGHGLSNRLTGGPANSGALSALQSGGMGEGWSDFWSLALLQKPGDTKNTPRPVGNYVLGQGPSGSGIRRYPYSYDMTVNPQTIAAYNADPNKFVHNTGELWAQTLWDMYWNLVEKWGYDSDLSAGTGGNNKAMQLVIDGMKLQPARPTFAQARDAILQADLVRYGGENAPQIWAAFARRGMGLSFNSGADANALVVVPATDMPQFLAISSVPLTGAVEGTAFTNRPIAILSDPDNLAAGQYTVTVNWGDNDTNGSVTLGNPVNGVYSITGTHKYNEGGTYRITITVVKATTGARVTTSQTVNVRGLDLVPLTPTRVIDGLEEGRPFPGLVAQFRDTAYNPNDPTSVPRAAGYFTAILSFPDGTKATGDITFDSKSGVYSVMDGSGHLYGGGEYDVAITIFDPGFTATTSARAIVTDSDLTATTLFPVTAIEGAKFDGALVAFTDADPRAPGVGNYFATINWGDDTSSKGVIKPNPQGAGFVVTGSHVYRFGSFPITVSIGNFSGPKTTSANPSATIANAPLASQGLDVTGSAGAAFRGIVASFSDADTRLNPTSHYVARVDWGDGVVSDGEVVVNSDGGYLVYGTHAYRTGSFRVTTDIRDVDGATTQAVSGAGVADAPATLALDRGFAPREGVAPAYGIIAQVVTSNLLAAPGDFVVTIDYGDGTSGRGTLSGAPGSGTFTVSSDKIYARAGTYGYTVVLINPGGSQSQALGTAIVSAAPVTVQARPLVATSKTNLAGVTVATFTSANPLAGAGTYAARIEWGDGRSSAGTIVADGAGGFAVRGDHTYAGGGRYPLSVTLTGVGLSTSSSALASISDLMSPITGQVASGSSVTNNARPTFTGRAEPNAAVEIYATPEVGGTPVLIGSGLADSSGVYTIQSSALGDGRYSVSASAKDAAGRPSSPLTPLHSSAQRNLLAIDTQGPQIANATLNARTGRVTLVLKDGLSGLSTGASTASNFSLRSANGQKFRLKDVTITPASGSSNETATLTFATPRPLRGGTYVLSVDASGVRDAAGNALDERYFVAFPGLYTRPGQDFVAAFRTNGRSSAPAQQYVPLSEILAARKHRRFVRSNLRRG